MSFLTDAFGGTSGQELSAYNAAWAQHPNQTGTTLNVSNEGRARSNSGTTQTQATYTNSATPSGADYYVEADLVAKSNIGWAGVSARAGHTSGDEASYSSRFHNGNGWRLIRNSAAGAATVLGTDTTDGTTLAVGSSRTFRLEVEGSTVRLKVSGALRLEVTDTNISTARRVGLNYRAGSDTVGYHLDNLVAAALGGGTPLQLTGAGTGSGSAAGNLLVSRLLARAALGAGTGAGSLQVTRLLVGAPAGAGSAAAAMVIARLLGGTAVGVGSAAATLAAARLLAGAPVGSGSAAGTLLIARLLQAAASGAGSAAGSLYVGSAPVLLSGLAVASGVAAGALRIDRRLAAEVLAEALVAGDPLVTRLLVGAATGAGSATGALLVGVVQLLLSTRAASGDPAGRSAYGDGGRRAGGQA